MKKIINIILISFMLIIFIFIVKEENEEINYESLYVGEKINKEVNYETSFVEEKSSKKNNYKNLYEENVPEINEEIIKVREYQKEEIADVYNGYSVCAKLQIPIISLETNVLQDYSTESLKVSVTKFWGVNPNENGNCCIVGHNFKNKNMFSNLKKLNIGDKLFITDKKIGKVEYEVFKIDVVVPEDVSCLEPITDNRKEVTLITCTNDSKKRIVIKAKELI